MTDVDFDRAGDYTPEQAREAVNESGVFVHNAINHAHWSNRLTSADEKERAQRAGQHRALHAGFSRGGRFAGVLIVVGHAKDGPADVIEERCRVEIKKLLPLAAALGQPILFENVWNQMHYQHDAPAEQSAEAFVKFCRQFQQPLGGNVLRHR